MVLVKELVGMFLRIRFITIILACVGLGIAPHFSWGQSHYRLAKAYADKNDAERASVYYGLALKSAAPSQVARIASDYATFLLRTNDLHKAELMLRQALSQSPHDEQLKKTLARCLVLQDKVIEGMRYYKSVGSEVEAKEEIMAIYQERGDSEVIAAVEQKWGNTRPESLYAEAVQRPLPAPVKAGITSPAAGPEKPNSIPLPMVGLHRNVDSRPILSERFAAADEPTQPLSKSELFDTRIPIPVPRSAPMSLAMNSEKPPAPVPPLLPAPKKQVLSVLARSTPARVEVYPMEKPPVPEKRTFAPKNPIKLSAATQPMLSTRYTSTSVVVPRQRKHYIINTSATSDLDALFPVKPVVAIVPAR